MEKFKPDFEKGLLPVIVQDYKTREVLMLAWTNLEAYEKTIADGETWFWSRSRKKLWHKGETSGHIQKIINIRLDCDDDALLYVVEQKGPGACHTGHFSCFYRELNREEADDCAIELAETVFDPKKVYL